MPLDPAERLARFKAEYPGLWESLNPDQKNKLRTAATVGGSYNAFKAEVLGFPVVEAWVAANPAADTTTTIPPKPPPVDGFKWVWNTDTLEWESQRIDDIDVELDPESSSSPTNTGEDIRPILAKFLTDNDLPVSLMGFINDALATGMKSVEIIARLRETPEYLAAYPENELRRQNGFAWMPEAQIRAARDEITRLTNDVAGVNLTSAEVATIISRDKSLSEWESQLMQYEDFKRWGPTVQAILQWELGYAIPDDRAFALGSATGAFLEPDLLTAYERALLRGQPAVLGLGIRPEEEAELLRRYGINPAQAFKGYQGIVGELPAAERFAAIENNINANAPNFPTGNDLFNDTPFATLFRAIQLGDTAAIRTLQEQMARETARFQATGGAVRSGTELVGLLPGGRQPT